MITFPKLSLLRAFALALPLLAIAPNAKAGSVSVSPTRLDGIHSNQTMLTVKAGGRDASLVQLRIVKWKKGTDPNRYSATRNVVVSPPMAKLGPRQELTVRIIRTSKKKPRGQECYRVLIDRLPGPKQRGQTVKLLVRQSVPLCFS